MTGIRLTDLFDIDELSLRIEQGYVSLNTHPTLPLSILNYTPAAQYERVWDDITTQCRGLIYDSYTGAIIARPFPKFFNLGEDDQYSDSDVFLINNSTPTISEKMDGSLGIIYTYRNHVAVATRGSFTSDQAKWATAHLYREYPDFDQPPGVTTLVEIIYPENRVVVDYGEKRELVLLGAILNSTGQDIPNQQIDWWNGPVTPTYRFGEGRSLEYIADHVQGRDWMATDHGVDAFADGEGVVLCYPRNNAPSFRIKVKHPRYVELHRIITGLSTRTVHEALASDTLAQLIDNVPDEFHAWVDEVSRELLDQFVGVLMRAEADLIDAKWLASGPGEGDYSRKDLAYEIQAHALYPGLCFALEDGKDISARIWDMIRPERETARILEDDDEG